MPEDPLKHIRSRLQRVGTNTQEIGRLCKDFLQSGFYKIQLETDSQGRFVVRFGDIDPFPESITILIGETAYVLRSTLDQLMFLLAKPPKGKEHLVEFPIVSNHKKFRTTNWKMPGVANGVRSVVESVQPYHRRKWPDTKLLGQLQELNNWDKHRLPPLHVFAFDGSGVNFRVGGPGGTILAQQGFRGSAKKGKMIARATGGGFWEVGSMVYPDIHMSFAPVFSNRMPMQLRNIHPLDVLGGAGEFIEFELLPRFERFI